MGYYYFMSTGLLWWSLVTPFIIAGIASSTYIFWSCICNSFKVHTYFGECHFRDTNMQLVRKQFFCPICFVSLETLMVNPNGGSWCNAFCTHRAQQVLVDYLEWGRLLIILFCEQFFWGYDLARNYDPSLLVHKGAWRL